MSNNKSLYSIKDGEIDTIPLRMDFIKKLLEGKILKPMIDFDVTETEYFINPKNYINSDNEYSTTPNSNDTRTLLNKKVHQFNDVIEQIGGKLAYIKSGTTGHTFKGILGGDDGPNYAIKVVAYPKKDKYGDIYDASRPENAELMMLRLLSYFVVKRQTPHITLPIGTFNTSIKPFIGLIDDQVVEKDNKKYNEFVERYKKKEYFDQVSILISEWANRGDLLDFFRKNYRKFKLTHWKVIFFQILSVLSVIHSKFPGFRHNDLKANNVLVQKIKKKNSHFTYKVCKNTYHVPNIGYQIKLWDFDFACIPDIINNTKVSFDKWQKSINVTPVQNRYYDMHYFFNTLIRKGFFPQILNDNCVPKEVKEFIHRIVPDKYKNDVNDKYDDDAKEADPKKRNKIIHERGRILINDEFLTPDKVLKKDPFFEEFRNINEKPKKVSKVSKSNNDTIKVESKINNEESKKTSYKLVSTTKPNATTELLGGNKIEKKTSRKQEKPKKTKRSDIKVINNEPIKPKRKYGSLTEEIDDIKLEDLLSD